MENMIAEKTEEQLKELFGPIHESQRGYFGWELFKHMAKDERIHLLVGDLGWGIFDKHFKYFPERATNCGAAEQAMMGIAVGLAMEGKIPFVYSITPFLLYRPFETIRNYVNREKIPVKLIGSGRNDDYKHDGFSHFAGDDRDVLKLFPNIVAWWPTDKEMIPKAVEAMIENGRPTYMNLTR